MAQQSFQGAIGAWAAKTKRRLEVVFKNSAEHVAEEVMWRTPVKTGFLRASLVASLDGPMPIRADFVPPPKTPDDHYAPPAEIALVIHTAVMGQKIFVSFVAGYARHVEYGTKHQNPAAMVRLAAQNWPHHVEQAIREAKAAVVARSPGSAPPSG